MKSITAVAALALAGSAVAAPTKLVPRQNINANGTTGQSLVFLACLIVLKLMLSLL